MTKSYVFYSPNLDEFSIVEVGEIASLYFDLSDKNKSVSVGWMLLGEL